MAVWENVHACDFTHSRKLHRRISNNVTLQYSMRSTRTKYEPVETNRSALSQRSLSSDLLAQTSMKMVMGTYLLYLMSINHSMAWHDLSGY